MRSDEIAEFATSRDTELWWQAAGTGPDLVLVHAGVATLEMWEPQVEALSDRYRCVRPDIRGFGRSGFGEGPYSMIADLGAVLDAAGVERAALVGCSIGGGIVVDYALQHPERVDSLVLMGVTPGGFDAPDPVLDEMLVTAEKFEEAGEWEALAELEARIWVDGPGREPGAAPEISAQVVEWLIPTYQVTGWGRSERLDPPAMERLDEIAVPTLVIYGEHDAAAIKAGCEATAAGIAGARLEVMADTAHLPNLERPAAFNALLGGFLDSAGGGSPANNGSGR